MASRLRDRRGPLQGAQGAVSITNFSHNVCHAEWSTSKCSEQPQLTAVHRSPVIVSPCASCDASSVLRTGAGPRQPAQPAAVHHGAQSAQRAAVAGGKPSGARRPVGGGGGQSLHAGRARPQGARRTSWPHGGTWGFVHQTAAPVLLCSLHCRGACSARNSAQGGSVHGTTMRNKTRDDSLDLTSGPR